jgi:hypothetical protein
MASQPALESSASQADSTARAALPQAAPAPAAEAQPGPLAASQGPDAPGAPEAADAPAAAMLAPGAPPTPAGELLAQGPLPALPPLSASHPPVIIGGMGGAPEIDGPAPVRQIVFERAVALPDLGQQVTVYRYRQADSSLEANRIMAANLGFDPEQLRPIVGAEGAYVVSEEGKGYLEIHGPGGAMIYESGDMGRKLGMEPGRPLPTDAEVVAAATRWLAELGLPLPDAGAPEVSVPFPGIKQVTLRPAEPRNIVTPLPQVRVSVDGAGMVVNAYLLWLEVESELEYPARTAESAWSLLESGRAEMRFEGEHNRPDMDLNIRITAAEMGYAITFASDGQAYLQPVLVFRGESSGGGESLPFAAWAPAVAGE